MLAAAATSSTRQWQSCLKSERTMAALDQAMAVRRAGSHHAQWRSSQAGTTPIGVRAAHAQEPAHPLDLARHAAVPAFFSDAARLAQQIEIDGLLSEPMLSTARQTYPAAQGLAFLPAARLQPCVTQRRRLPSIESLAPEAWFPRQVHIRAHCHALHRGKLQPELNCSPESSFLISPPRGELLPFFASRLKGDLHPLSEMHCHPNLSSRIQAEAGTSALLLL